MDTATAVPTTDKSTTQQHSLTTVQIISKTALNAVCGAAAGISADLVLHPLDTVKTHMQVQGQIDGKTKYKTSAHAFGSILKEGGLGSIYKGMGPAIVGTGLSGGTYFCVYEMMKSLLLKNEKLASNEAYKAAAYFTAGFIGDFFGTMFYVPCDIVKQRMQLKSVENQGVVNMKIPGYDKYYSSMPRAIYAIVKYEGIRGLFSGLLPTMARDCPYSAFQFLFYETFKNLFVKHNKKNHAALGKDEIYTWQSMLSGALSGGIAAQITNPMDVVKTRTQVQEKYKNLSLGQSLKKIYKEEGILALWKGNLPRSSWLIVAGSIIFATYEQVRSLAAKQFPTLYMHSDDDDDKI